MWESVPPNQTVSIPLATKISWATIPVNTIISMYKTSVLKYPDFEWVVYSPDSFYNSLFPTIDHTLSKSSGNYLLMKGGSPRKVGDRAILVSDHYDIDSSRSLCLQFYYYFKNQYTSLSNPPRFEVYLGEDYSTNVYRKIGQVIGTITNTSWTKFEITATAITTNSKNLWFYLVIAISLSLSLSLN